MKICFLAPSGYGKTTAIEILKRHFDITNIKIAAPLYELQEEFYKKLGKEVGNKQDGELLQYYGKKIREVDSGYLLKTFKEKLDSSNTTIITNDDCRPNDFEFLKENGFLFIKINGYKRDRDDITLANDKLKIEWQSEIPFDYQINNYDSMEDYEKELLKLIRNLLSPKCYVIPTQKACNCNCNFCISKVRNYNKDTEFLQVNNNFIENIYNLKKHEINRFEITGGGEPFLNKNLQELISTIKRIIPDSYIKLYTNGNILKDIHDVDEIDISVVHNDTDINKQFMNGNDLTLEEKINFFRKKVPKLRLSIPLIKGGIDSKEKLNNLINNTKEKVDEYVVRTLYPGTPNLEELYLDFDFSFNKVVIERQNDFTSFDGLILWSDNQFYNSWDLNSRKYLNSYLLLKPDSRTYINEIEEQIKERGFTIKKRLLIDNFKRNILNLYGEKNEQYLQVVKRHLEAISYLFGDTALALILDKDCSIDELYYQTLKLKEELREKYSFTHAYNGYITKENNISHVNIAHCPDPLPSLFNRDINFLEAIASKEVDTEDFQKIKKYRSYNI